MSHYLLTALTMVAFASNSILCRMALGGQTIDAASFTAIRLLSGAAMLALILAYRNHDFSLKKINPVSAMMLYIYAACFSFSYINLSVATGALLLFGAVQLTMIGFAFAKGERPGVCRPGRASLPHLRDWCTCCCPASARRRCSARC